MSFVIGYLCALGRARDLRLRIVLDLSYVRPALIQKNLSEKKSLHWSLQEKAGLVITTVSLGRWIIFLCCPCLRSLFLCWLFFFLLLHYEFVWSSFKNTLRITFLVSGLQVRGITQQLFLHSNKYCTLIDISLQVKSLFLSTPKPFTEGHGKMLMLYSLNLQTVLTVQETQLCAKTMFSLFKHRPSMLTQKLLINSTM